MDAVATRDSGCFVSIALAVDVLRCNFFIEASSRVVEVARLLVAARKRQQIMGMTITDLRGDFRDAALRQVAKPANRQLQARAKLPACKLNKSERFYRD